VGFRFEECKEAYNLECLVTTVKHGGGSVMIWVAISLYSAGPIITVNDQITASDCMNILGVWMCPIVRMLYPNNDAVIQDDS
jgi:hypothetical protein